jgi:diguanylate cyclase
LFVAHLDLDGFKPVNDRLGHEQGDVLLRAVVKRLEMTVGSAGLVARVGGDEFVILFEHTDRRTVQTWIDSFELAMTEPFVLTSEGVRVGASVGLAFYPDHGDVLEDLLRVADGAMYQDKQLKSRWRQRQESSPIRHLLRHGGASRLI